MRTKRVWVQSCLIVGLLVCGWGLPSQGWAANPDWEKGNKCFEQADFACAIRHLQKALGMIPPVLSKAQRYEGLIKLSRSFLTEGNRQKALGTYQMALQLSPCKGMPKMPPSFVRRYTAWKKAWCQTHPKRCKLCTCSGPICPKKIKKCPSCKKTKTPLLFTPGSTAIFVGVALASAGVGGALMLFGSTIRGQLLDLVIAGQPTSAQDQRRANAENASNVGAVLVFVGATVLTTQLIISLIHVGYAGRTSNTKAAMAPTPNKSKHVAHPTPPQDQRHTLLQMAPF